MPPRFVPVFSGRHAASWTAGGAWGACAAFLQAPALQPVRLLIVENRFARKVDAAEPVDLRDLDHDLVADLNYVLHLGYMVVRQLADMHQSLFSGQHFYEGAEVLDPGYLAGVNGADFDILGKAFHPADGGLCAFLAG